MPSLREHLLELNILPVKRLDLLLRRTHPLEKEVRAHLDSALGAPPVCGASVDVLEGKQLVLARFDGSLG